MSPATHHELRARVCGVLQQLGRALDGLQFAAEVSRLPGDPAADAVVALRHLEEAACALDSASTLVNDTATFLDMQIDLTKQIAAPFLAAEQGGAA